MNSAAHFLPSWAWMQTVLSADRNSSHFILEHWRSKALRTWDRVSLHSPGFSGTQLFPQAGKGRQILSCSAFMPVLFLPFSRPSSFWTLQMPLAVLSLRPTIQYPHPDLGMAASSLSFTIMFLMQTFCLATCFFFSSRKHHVSWLCNISLSPFFLPQAPKTLSRTVWADYCMFSKWADDKVFPISGELRYRAQCHARCLAPCSDLVLGGNIPQQPSKSSQSWDCFQQPSPCWQSPEQLTDLLLCCFQQFPLILKHLSSSNSNLLVSHKDQHWRLKQKQQGFGHSEDMLTDNCFTFSQPSLLLISLPTSAHGLATPNNDAKPPAWPCSQVQV